MLKIALIEDDDSDAFMIQKAIEDHMKDAVCTRADTLEEGERMIREEGADVVLLDLRLPDGDSPTDVCARIAKCAGEAPIVISSNATDHDLARTLVHEGAEDFLNKQLIAEKPQHVRDAIEFAIERHNALQKAIREKERALKESEEKDAVLHCFMGGYSVNGQDKPD